MGNNKKIILLIAVSLFFITYSYSQISGEKKFLKGIGVGGFFDNRTPPFTCLTTSYQIKKKRVENIFSFHYLKLQRNYQYFFGGAGLIYPVGKKDGAIKFNLIGETCFIYIRDNSPMAYSISDFDSYGFGLSALLGPSVSARILKSFKLSFEPKLIISYLYKTEPAFNLSSKGWESSGKKHLWDQNSLLFLEVHAAFYFKNRGTP